MDTISVDSSQDKSDVIAMETKQKGSLIRQDDPYKVYEHLQLSLEEVCKIAQSVVYPH